MKKNKKYEKVSVIFMQLGLLFTVCLIAANIFETKEIVVGSITLTGGLLIFPLTYVICRAVCEVWGFQRASLLIWMGFLLNFLFIGVAALVDVIPGVASADVRSTKDSTPYSVWFRASRWPLASPSWLAALSVPML